MHKGCAAAARLKSRRTPTSTPTKPVRDPKIKTVIPVQDRPLASIPESEMGAECGRCSMEIQPDYPCRMVTWTDAEDYGWMHEACLTAAVREHLMSSSPGSKAPSSSRALVPVSKEASQGGIRAPSDAAREARAGSGSLILLKRGRPAEHTGRIPYNLRTIQSLSK